MAATVFEILFAAALLVGVLNREKLIALESPIKAAVAVWLRQNIRGRVRK